MYAILTKTENGFGLPVVKIVHDQQVGTNEDGSPVMRSDYTESERQQMGFATFTKEDVSGYVPGDPLDTLTASGCARTYPDKEAKPNPTVITYSAFRERFTSGELSAVKSATLTDADCLDWALVAAANNAVDLAGDEVDSFLDAMVTAEAITSQRKTEILTP